MASSRVQFCRATRPAVRFSTSPFSHVAAQLQKKSGRETVKLDLTNLNSYSCMNFSAENCRKNGANIALFG